MLKKRSLHDFLQLVVQYQHEGATHAPEDIGPGPLEESLATLVTGDLLPAVDGPSVHDVGCGRRNRGERGKQT